MKQEVIERFISYSKVDTQANENFETCPTTPGQLELVRKLADELAEIGLEDISIDDNGYLFATLPSNTEKEVPVIGFLAHVDTAPETTGAGVNPLVVDAYDGGNIVLNEKLNVVLSPKSFPELAGYVGQTLITTDGTTLLGADDKAGVAEIMTAMNYLKQHPEIKHGKIRVGFTPDEEIGRGPHRFDVAAFGAEYAYTMDGGPLGELEYESFNAAVAKVVFHGISVHPGTAKGKMINSAKVAIAFVDRMPAGEAPEFTEGREGFYHLASFQGGVTLSTISYIIRDFDRTSFEARKTFLHTLAEEFRQTYGENSIELEIRDQYFNMREKIEPVRHIVDIAHKAMTNLGIEPEVKAIRGGTDGSQLSYMGLPTPNIFAGGENFHGKYEYISADTMVKATEVIVEIVQLFEAQA